MDPPLLLMWGHMVPQIGKGHTLTDLFEKEKMPSFLISPITEKMTLLMSYWVISQQ